MQTRGILTNKACKWIEYPQIISVPPNLMNPEIDTLTEITLLCLITLFLAIIISRGNCTERILWESKIHIIKERNIIIKEALLCFAIKQYVNIEEKHLISHFYGWWCKYLQTACPQSSCLSNYPLSNHTLTSDRAHQGLEERE